MGWHPRAPRSWCQLEPSSMLITSEACKRYDRDHLRAQNTSATVSVIMAYMARAAFTAARPSAEQSGLTIMRHHETTRQYKLWETDFPHQTAGRAIKLIRVRTYLRHVQRQFDIFQTHNVSFEQPLGVMLPDLLACHSYDTRCLRPMSRSRPQMTLLLCLQDHKV